MEDICSVEVAGVEIDSQSSPQAPMGGPVHDEQPIGDVDSVVTPRQASNAVEEMDRGSLLALTTANPPTALESDFLLLSWVESSRRYFCVLNF